MEALFVLALLNGIRRGEIVALKLSYVNLTDGEISVQRSLVELKGRYNRAKAQIGPGILEYDLPVFHARVPEKNTVNVTAHARGGAEVAGRQLVFCTSHGTQFAAVNLRTEFKVVKKSARLSHDRFCCTAQLDRFWIGPEPAL